LLVKPTPRNVNLSNVRFAMFNNQRDIAFISFLPTMRQTAKLFTAATLAWLWSTRRHTGVKENF
jgi:hypothetical protein